MASLNLEDFYAQIQVSAVQAGPTTIAPEILLALWFSATIETIEIDHVPRVGEKTIGEFELGEVVHRY